MSTAVASIVSASEETTSNVHPEREQLACALNDTQKEILTATWKQVDSEEKKQQIGIILFKRILEIAPGAIVLFPKFRDVPKENLEENEDFRKHSYGVVDAIGLAVSFLDDIETLEGVLCDLGSTHAKYQIQDPHFKVVGEALMGTLKHEFGTAFTPDIATAWATFYGFVSSSMRKGLHEAYAAQEE